MEWDHNTLAEDLADHLRLTTDRLAWTNMPMGPAGTVRPDVFTLSRTFSRFAPISYEVKVSVSDFRADVTAGKWSEYLAFSSAVVFAVPAGLITRKDIPEGCGLMTRSDAGWKTAKAPTLRTVDNLPKSTWMKILFDGLERLEKDRRLGPRKANDWETAKKLRGELGADVAAVLVNREFIAAEAKKLLALLQLSDRYEKRDIRESYWHLADLTYWVKNTLEIWRQLAGILGEESTLPDYRDMNRVRDKVGRLKPGANLDEVKEFMGVLRRDIELAEKRLGLLEPCPLERNQLPTE